MNEPTQRPIAKSTSSGPSHARSEASANDAQQQAAAAALARLDKKKEPTQQQRSAALIRAQALKELEQEQQKNALQKLSITEPKSSVHADQLAVSGVYYKCPLIGTFFNEQIWLFNPILFFWPGD